MLIRRASLDDCAEICGVHIASIHGVCAPSGLYTPEQIEAWAAPKKPENYVAPMEQYLFYVCVSEGRIVGFGDVDTAAPAADVEGDAEVRGLYFAPEGCGRGWGAAMMHHLEAIAWSFGARTVRVDGTLCAAPFYSRLGYVVRARRMYRFPSGVEAPCVRMVRVLSPG
jgi:GNAT superfamily N-acetyltransferase